MFGRSSRTAVRLPGGREVHLPRVPVPDLERSRQRLSEVRLPEMSVPDVRKAGRHLSDLGAAGVHLPDLHLPHVPRPNISMADLRVPDVRLPEMHLPQMHRPDFHLPHVSLPDVHRPDLHLPRVSVPSVPDVQMPRLDFSNLHVPGVDLSRLRDFEWTGQPPFVRRRPPNRLVQALKFATGLAAGLFLGAIAAALLAPGAGEDNRRRLLELIGRGDPGPSLPDERSSSSGEVTRGRRLASSRPDSAGAARRGLLDEWRERFEEARAAAAAAREARERQVRATYVAARSSGRMPD